MVFKKKTVVRLRNKILFRYQKIYQNAGDRMMFLTKCGQEAEWIIFFEKSGLFEWFRDRLKEQTHIEIFLE